MADPMPRSMSAPMQQDATQGAVTANPRLSYHLKELEIALDPASVHHAMPEFLSTDNDILDIGCGIGQLFVASPRIHGKRLVGFDIDSDCLAYGQRQFNYITYVNGSAERLPFQAGSFDLLVSRVSLPYTDIRRSLCEANRVLRVNGRIWFTLHSFSMTIRHLMESLRAFAVKDTIYTIYVLVNGCVLHFSGKQFPFIFAKRNESFQTTKGIHRAMKYAGFEDIRVERSGELFLCKGHKQASDVVQQ